MNRRTSALTTSVLSALLLLGGCGDEAVETSNADPKSAGTAGDGESAPSDLLAEHGLQGLDVEQVIDKLESGDEQVEGLTATVDSDEVVLTDPRSGDQVTLPLGRKFYLSVAPYVDTPAQCDQRSLTEDQAELVDQELRVLLIGLDGEVVATNTVRTDAHGFVGFWLQRDIDATLQMSYEGHSGHADISTNRNAPTCMALKLR